MKRRLFLDLDGVMVDFDKHFTLSFNREPPYRSAGTLTDKTMWEMIYAHGSFFRTAPLFQGAKEFFKQLVDLGFDPVILTACSQDHYIDVAAQKREHVREHLTKDHLIMPVPGGKYKQLFMHAPGDILIDDWNRNCKRWEEAGGVAILHKNFEATLIEIGKILFKDEILPKLA